MSMSHFCRAWWAKWGLGSLAGGKRYHFSPGYTTEADLAIKCGSGAVVGIAVVGIAVVGTAVVGIAAVGIAACTPPPHCYN